MNIVNEVISDFTRSTCDKLCEQKCRRIGDFRLVCDDKAISSITFKFAGMHELSYYEGQVVMVLDGQMIRVLVWRETNRNSGTTKEIGHTNIKYSNPNALHLIKPALNAIFEDKPLPGSERESNGSSRIAK